MYRFPKPQCEQRPWNCEVVALATQNFVICLLYLYSIFPTVVEMTTVTGKQDLEPAGGQGD